MACKGCEIKEQAKSAEKVIKELIAEQLLVEKELVSPEISNKRVFICQNCPSRLNYTCTKCGCYYEFRANLAIKSCPLGKW